MPADQAAISELVRAAYSIYLERFPLPPVPMLADYGSLIAAERAVVATQGGHVEGVYTGAQMTENVSYYPRRGFVETHRATEDGRPRVHFARRLDS